MKPTREHIQKLFERDTIEEVIPSREAFEKHLLEEKKMHIYLGIDPTAEQIHLGHVQNILFLEDLRKLGVKTTLLFGSFTGMIGDPSDRESTRPQLTRENVRKNMRLWKKQVKPVLPIGWLSGASVQYNNKWFDKMAMEEFLKVMRETTVQQLLERDMFQKRLKDGKPLHTHEMIYPLLQGYDSVAMQVDAELCGTDQTFNALMGRTMMRRFLNKEKFVITMRLIHSDGVMMSKSAGTGVFVDKEKNGSHRMFGGIMALPDGFILPIYKGCTRIPIAEIEKMDLSGGTKTRDAKIRLAKEIVSMFWGKDDAKKAEEAYITQFRNKEAPKNTPSISVQEEGLLLDVVAEHAAQSRTEAKRKFTQGAVSLDGEKIKDLQYKIKKGKEKTLRVGRKIYILR